MWQPRSADELRNLTALAQAAVGYDAARGDQLTVEDLAFDQNRSQQPPAALEKWVNTAEDSPLLIKYAALLCGLLVVLAFGVRPALRQAGSALLGAGVAKSGARELASGAATASSFARSASRFSPAAGDRDDTNHTRDTLPGLTATTISRFSGVVVPAKKSSQSAWSFLT